MHQDVDPPAVIRIIDTTTKADIEEAMGFITQTLHRMPSHWADRRAALHARLDALLVGWEAAS